MTELSDHFWMRRALKLAVRGRHASPNPMVGCVIVDPSGQRVGEGFHPEPGQPHAEVFALREAGIRSAGATAYVTLEPCAHFGRTPPCADALIAAGVSKVVIAMVDPDPRVSGQGIAKLHAANIQTVVGVLAAEANSLNRSFIHHRITGVPWVTIKIATTLDGKIATTRGDSKWITGPLTRLWVHRQLRDRSDAVLVGVNTVLQDDPMLTTRLSNQQGRDPLRVILDSRLRTPLTSNIVRMAGDDGKTVIACLSEAAGARGPEYLIRGVELMPLQPDNNGRVNIMRLLQELGTQRDVSSVLVEGGSSVIASMLSLGLVNRYITTIAPILIGGKYAVGPIGGAGLASTMKEAVHLKQWKARRSASDLVIDALLTQY